MIDLRRHINFSSNLLNKFVSIKLFVVCSVILVGEFVSFSQDLSTNINHDRAKLGDRLEVSYLVKSASKMKVDFQAQKDVLKAIKKNASSSLNHNEDAELELISPFFDSSYTKAGINYWVGKYEVMVWDTGRIVIPNQPIVIDDSTYYFNSIEFHVTGKTIGALDELFDIEEGFADVSSESTWKDYLEKYWYVLAVGFVLLIVLIYVLIRRKKVKTIDRQVMMSLKDRTLQAIQLLEKREVWRNGDFKAHYSELSHIIRMYLSSRYQLNLLEKTTFETKLLLQQTPMTRDMISSIMMILSQADMVKFANSESDEINVLNVNAVAQRVVVETSPLEMDEEEFK
ncbi:MAG TPA: hypothetical protein VKZ44_01415 [Taishania sp.]|nr:hypothetical protein [Taishania sp.]